MRTETLTYQADGLNMVNHLYWDETLPGRRPGVLVFPEAFGLEDHAKSRAERLANMGYIALACDLHGDGKVIRDLPAVMPMIAALRADPVHRRARAGGALAALVARPQVAPQKIAAIGFCFGGTMSLDLARSGAEIAAVVGFHCGLATKDPQDAKNIRCKVLICTGADDPAVPAQQRADFEKEMTDAKVDWRMHVYGGVLHSFTNPEADRMGRPELARYDAGADARSWAEMLALFDEVLGKPG